MLKKLTNGALRALGLLFVRVGMGGLQAAAVEALESGDALPRVPGALCAPLRFASDAIVTTLRRRAAMPRAPPSRSSGRHVLSRRQLASSRLVDLWRKAWRKSAAENGDCDVNGDDNDHDDACGCGALSLLGHSG